MTHPVRFRHITTRIKRNADGSITKKPSRLKYTVAYSFTNVDGKLDIAYGVAQCRHGSEGDTFNRVVGRQLAEARLNDALNGTANSRFSGRLSVEDANNLNVGRYVAEQYEAARKASLNK